MRRVFAWKFAHFADQEYAKAVVGVHESGNERERCTKMVAVVRIYNRQHANQMDI